MDKLPVTHSDAADALFPRSYSRQVDLVERLVRELEIDALRCDGELECHGLVSLCHGCGPRTPQNNHSF